MSQFTVHEAKTNLSRLIASALNGEEIVIAKGNVPAVRLVPIKSPAKRQFGALRGMIRTDERFHEPLPPEEVEGWNL